MTTTGLDVIRLFLLDDHPLMHRALESALAAAPAVELVGGATSSRDALERLAAAAPQVALVDITLADGDGVSLARRIREEHPEVHCLMFTWHGDEEALLAAVLADASGYVIKQINSEGIVEAVSEAAQGERLLDPKAVAALVTRCRAAGRRPEGSERFSWNRPRLNARELAIFDDAVAGLTDSEIGDRQQMSAETANRYVSLIFTKFGLWLGTPAARRPKP